VKNILHTLLFLGINLCIYYPTEAQSVVLNEVMSKNTNTLQNNEGESPDWIEIYNPSNVSINLLGYHLSDDPNHLTKWKFPSITVLPEHYFIVFASGEESTENGEIATNFKLSSFGEPCFLSDPSGTLIDSIVIPPMNENESYGRVVGFPGIWAIQETPTPNSANTNDSSLLFSHQSGFYQASFKLGVLSTSQDSIFYTLNGNKPSPENGILYTDSLLIEKATTKPNKYSLIPTSPPGDLTDYKEWVVPSSLIQKATILRFASFKEGIQTSRVYSHHFFVETNTTNALKAPYISIVLDSIHLFDRDSGIYVPGAHYTTDQPTTTGNYFHKGRHWEKKAHLMYFQKNKKAALNQDIGIRIHGGVTRHAAQKSLRLYARTEYGKNTFKHPLFNYRENLTSYKRFILRSSMGGWDNQSMIKDAYAQNIVRTLNFETQDMQPVIVYLNGEYWGIHNLMERIDSRYLAYINDLNPDSIFFKEDKPNEYNTLLDYVDSNTLEVEEHYQYVAKQIDIDNFINYQIAETYFSNYDWPANNVKIWKTTDSDSKWRWVFYDIDAGFIDVNRNAFKHATRNDSGVTWPNSPESTLLFRSLLQNKGFQNRFINRYAELLSSTFNKEKCFHKLDSIKALYSPLIEEHIDRWDYPESIAKWEEDIQHLKYFIENRNCVIEEQIQSFFNINNFAYTCLTPKNIETAWHIGPNPSNGKLLIYNNTTKEETINCTVYNTTGQQLFYKPNINILPYEKQRLNLNTLSNGIYIITLWNKHLNISKKISLIGT